MVDDQLKLGRLHYRQVRGLRAFEDAAGIDASLTPGIRGVGSVAHQPSGYGKVSHRICRRECVAGRELYHLDAPADEQGVGRDEEGVHPSNTSPMPSRSDMLSCVESTPVAKSYFRIQGRRDPIAHP